MHERYPVVVGRGRVNDQSHGPWLASSVRLHGDQRPRLIRGILHGQRQRSGLAVAGGVRDEKLPRVAGYHPQAGPDVLEGRDDRRQALTRVQHLSADGQVQLVRLLHYAGRRTVHFLLEQRTISRVKQGR